VIRRRVAAFPRPTFVVAWLTSPLVSCIRRRLRHETSSLRLRSSDTQVDFRLRNDRARTTAHARIVAREMQRSNAAAFYAVTACACTHQIVPSSIDYLTSFFSASGSYVRDGHWWSLHNPTQSDPPDVSPNPIYGRSINNASVSKLYHIGWSDVTEIYDLYVVEHVAVLCEVNWWRAVTLFKQEAQLQQRYRATRCVNSCYVSRAVEVIKVSNSKSDLQNHSRALAMVPFDRPRTISC